MKIPTRAKVLGAALSAIGLAAAGVAAAQGDVAQPAPAAVTTDQATAPAAPAAQSAPADDLVRQVAQALQSAKSLHADFEEIDSFPGRYKDLAQRGTVVLARPGLLRIDIHRFRRISADEPWAPSGNDTAAVSDGNTYWFAFLHPHSTQVRQETASDKSLRSALKVLPLLRPFFGSGTHAKLPQQDGDATLEASETWEGASYRVLQYSLASDNPDQDDAGTAKAYIGDDSLIHRLVFTTETPAGPSTKEWNLRGITLNADVPASTFAYSPPADATALDQSPRGALLAEGTLAPDFTLTDAHGKAVSLSDYKGKTVVLDFWATWCWPCNQSLPVTESVAHTYKDQNVVTLAVAIWDSKAGFDAWIARHNYPDINFAVDPRPQGTDVASSLYHVGTTPTAYVIAPDGKVVKSIAGFAGHSDELVAAIQAAQASKTASLP